MSKRQLKCEPKCQQETCAQPLNLRKGEAVLPALLLVAVRVNVGELRFAGDGIPKRNAEKKRVVSQSMVPKNTISVSGKKCRC